jgi:hypothetical protein
VTDTKDGESIDRNKAIGYLVARAMAAEVFGNKERCKAFTEAAHILKSMPSKDLNKTMGERPEKLSGPRPRQ